MKQVLAEVVENVLISDEPHFSLGRPVSESRLIWLKNCGQIVSEARPGQFVMIRCAEGLTLPRPFSVHQVKGKEKLALLFSVWEEGKGTNWLSKRKIGESVEIFGPLGNGFSILPSSRNLLLIAGGIGLAPFLFLSQKASINECSLTLLLGTKKAQLLNKLKELLPADIKAVLISEEGPVGNRGKVTDLLTPEMISWADQIFINGPMPMYRDMAAQKQKMKLEEKPVQVSLEVRMGCGVGVCYGCTVKTRNGLKQVCTDGPVFELDDVLWDQLPC